MSNKKNKIQVVLLILFISAIFVQSSHNIGLAEEKAFVVEKNIVYGKVEGVELKLDLARPEKGRRLPALIFIFASFWHTGNRSQFSSNIREAAQRGYVAVTIDYRLTNVLNEDRKPKYQFPDQVHDVKCAVRWLRANAKKYKINPNRIGAIGRSSGGHLALMLGLTDPTDGLEGGCGDLQFASNVQAVVSLAGLTNMEYCGSSMWCISFLGGTPEEVPGVYEMASPITYVSTDDPPVLIIHGDKDGTVPIKHAELLDEMMTEVGVDHAFIIKKNVGHGVTVDNDVWDFFDKYLK
jgi:acetyl esterase/lipase